LSGNKDPNLKTTVLKKPVLFLIISMIIALSPACEKDKGCDPKHPGDELSQIQAYAAANGINATAHPSGLYYEIVNMGTGDKAHAGSKISITYTGKLMNGQTFDEALTPNVALWPLSGLIEGWIIGIPLINEGGHIKLIIPSSLAYGCNPYYEIPGNSVLFFDIHLVDVQ
jgi:FKBP-type peptidyl-prolyl cis-trans isomerase FkpA